MLVQPISTEYAAGLFDGEGCIHLGKGPQFRKTIMMGVTYRPIVESFVAKYGGKLYKYASPTGSRAIYRWQLSSKAKIKNFLNSVRPFLLEKAAQADLMLYLVENKTNAYLLEEAYQDMKHLKIATYLEETEQFPMLNFGYHPVTKRLAHLNTFKQFY